MSCTVLTAVIAVFENIPCFSMEKWGWSRSKAVRFYVTWLLPFIVLAIFVLGYVDKFF